MVSGISCSINDILKRWIRKQVKISVKINISKFGKIWNLYHASGKHFSHIMTSMCIFNEVRKHLSEIPRNLSGAPFTEMD